MLIRADVRVSTPDRIESFADKARIAVTGFNWFLGLVVVGEQRKCLDGVLGLCPKGAFEIRDDVTPLGDPFAKGFISVTYQRVCSLRKKLHHARA